MEKRKNWIFLTLFDTLPWSLFPCRCGLVQTSLGSCAAVCAVGLSLQRDWWPCWGDTLTETQLAAAGSCLCVVRFCYGCYWLSSLGPRIERWGFHFYALSSSPPTILLLQCKNTPLVLEHLMLLHKPCHLHGFSYCDTIQDEYSCEILGVLPEHD